MIDRILVNREECELRVAFLEKDSLVELHTEKFDDQTIVNNIYRGRVQDVVPGLQAVFVDVGLERNMFLHFMDIRPESLVLSAEDQFEAMKEASAKSMPGRIERRGRRPRQDPSQPQAESPVKKGDEIIVQVVKDEIGGKAPRVTTNLSLAGRYLVLLPFPSQDGGVSRKIAMGQDRFRLKKLLASLRTSEHSFIVRTAGLGQGEEAIEKDAEALERLWLSILKRYKDLGGPGLVNSDDNLIARLVRDAFPSDFQEVICDYPADGEEIHRMLTEQMTNSKGRVRFWEGTENIFEHYGVEKQIKKAMDRKVWLKSGGHLIIDENEALTAIDVNTGRFTGRKEQEKTSLKTNMEACEAIAQQIRLRDIGGIIVIDFIDMVNRSHQEKVSEELRRHLKNDRAKSALGKIGDFGVMMLTRKRQRMSLQNQLFEECPYCKGTGLVLLPDEIFRRLKYDLRRLVAEQENLGGILVTAHPHFIGELTSRFTRAIEEIANKSCEIFYKANADYHMEDYQVTPIRGAEGEVIRLPGSRLEDTSRVLPVADVTDPAISGAMIASIPSAKIEDIRPPATATSQESSGEDAQDGGGRKRRRRSRQGGKPEEAGSFEVTAEIIQTESTGEGVDQQAGETAEEAQQRRRRESSAERRARRRRAKDRRHEDTDAPGEIASGNGKDEPTKAPAQKAPVPVPALPTGPLKLTTIAKSKNADLLSSVLDEIDKDIEVLSTSKGAKGRRKPVARKTPAAAKKKAAAPDPEKKKKALADVFASMEKDLDLLKKSDPPKEKPAKTAARSRGKTTDEKEKAAAKPAKKAPAKKTTTSKAKEPATAKTSAKKETAAAKKAPAKKATKSEAAEPKKAAAKKTTTKAATATKAKKASTTGESKAKSSQGKKAASTPTRSKKEPVAKKTTKTAATKKPKQGRKSSKE